MTIEKTVSTIAQVKLSSTIQMKYRSKCYIFDAADLMRCPFFKDIESLKKKTDSELTLMNNYKLILPAILRDHDINMSANQQQHINLLNIQSNIRMHATGLYICRVTLDMSSCVHMISISKPKHLIGFSHILVLLTAHGLFNSSNTSSCT